MEDKIEKRKGYQTFSEASRKNSETSIQRMYENLVRFGNVVYCVTPEMKFHGIEHSDIFIDEATETCEHKWKTHQGLNEKFDYCEICDKKRDVV
jgi:hypothetical protein